MASPSRVGPTPSPSPSRSRRQALREGAGARAVELHVLAARILERVWRTEGREQDAKEAIDLYLAGGRSLGVPGACEASMRGAMLAGDLAHDASSTYAELYRAERRMAALDPAASRSVCASSVERELSLLEAFRPPSRVLEAIDQGLAGEGAIAVGSGAGVGVGVVRQSRIERVEDWPGGESARVVIVLDRPARFHAGDEVAASAETGAPVSSTYVDLEGVDVGGAARDARLGGIVRRVTASPTAAGARVTLELEGHAFRRVFYLPEPYRVVIDIARHPPGAVPTRGRRTVSRVVLDPGHGGSDPGAQGPGGVREKDVTLDLAHRIAPILAKDGLEVVLTRDDDRFVTLEERTARANGFVADLFVSIHCNAAESRLRHGIETYVLDTTRDEIAARVATRENATSQAATAELGSILANMRLADQASRSTRFAELLQRAALASLRDSYSDVVDGGVHPAAFYVLVGARMPSVLLETSYVSNPVEEHRLGSDDYRQRLADAVVNAVEAYRQGR